jgi:hypothetical protein
MTPGVENLQLIFAMLNRCGGVWLLECGLVFAIGLDYGVKLSRNTFGIGIRTRYRLVDSQLIGPWALCPAFR